MLTRLSGRCLFASVILVAACVGGDKSLPLAPNLDISDAAHAAGTPGFYFLPPMVPNPVTSGVFDPDIVSLNPAILICDLTAGVDCGGTTPALRAFSITSTPAIVIADEKYKVNWNTKEGAFTAGRTYRIHVFAGSGANRRELGFADVLLTSEPGKAKHLASGETIVLNDGRTLPIQFRIETGSIVPPGPATSFELTGLPASVIAGSPASVTITARDGNGQIASGYRETVAFTSSDPTATLPEPYAFTEADAGTHTFSGIIWKTAGTATLLATDAALTREATTSVEPAAAVTLVLSDLPSAVTAGAANSLTVSARDEFGNRATGYRGAVAFTSTDPAATLPTAYSFTESDAGTHAFAGVILRTGGDVTVTASDIEVASMTGSQTTVVGAGAAASLVLTGLTEGAAAGSAQSLTVTARDVDGNVAIGYTGTIALTSTDPLASLPEAYTFTAADAGSHEFAGAVILRTAGVTTVTVTDQAVASMSGAQTITVTPAGAAALVLSGIPELATAGQPYDLTVTARDAFGNLATGYGATVQFTSSDPAAELPAPYPFQPSDGGAHTFAGVVFKTAGAQLLQASDGTIGADAAVTVEPGAAAVLRFTAQPSDVQAGEVISPPVVVTAYDGFDNIATGFAGPVTVALGANPGAGTLSGTLSVGPLLGIATFGDLRISTGGNGYTIVASAGGLAGAISEAFDVAFPGMVVVSPGRAHACALDQNGRAFCWGQSESGQLGNGSTATRVTPIAVSGGLTFASIDAGSFHTCAVTHAGAAYCWGLNQAGRLGDGTLNNRLVPVQVAGNHTFSMISAGERNTCGVTTSHEAYCWGEGAFRALGNGSTTSTPSPVLVAGGHSFASLSVGTDFACGVTTSGQGLCWGTASSGALGSGSTTPQPTPGPIAGGLTLGSISAGQAHACGVTTAGAGYCWGVGQFGRLGNGSGLNSLTPVPVSGNLVFAQISAGALHSCGVSTAGTGYCWGGNIDGDLGTGSPFSATTPTLVLGGLSWASIHAGGLIPPSLSSSDSFSFTCGVSAAGQTYCWGSGQQGQLGNGSTGPRGTPTAVAAFP